METDERHQIPVEWIAAAGLVGFKPRRSGFRCDEPHTLDSVRMMLFVRNANAGPIRIAL